MDDFEVIIAELESRGWSTAPVDSGKLTPVRGFERFPGDYQRFLSSFGNRPVELFCWTLPPIASWPDLDKAFRFGGAPSHLLPFAEQDGTWFMAFDLTENPPKVVEWDHEDGAAQIYPGSFAAWLALQLERETEMDREEEQALDEQSRWASLHVPFCETHMGKQVQRQLQTEAGAQLRDVLLDLHLQYTFHPHVVLNGGIFYVGMLHFRDDAIGCWRCGELNGLTRRQCTRCNEALLLRTFFESRGSPSHTSALEEPFGDWVERHLNLTAPAPLTIVTPVHPSGIPLWARFTKFGGTRDPRVPGDDFEEDWNIPDGDII